MAAFVAPYALLCGFPTNDWSDHINTTLPAFCCIIVGRTYLSVINMLVTLRLKRSFRSSSDVERMSPTRCVPAQQNNPSIRHRFVSIFCTAFSKAGKSVTSHAWKKMASVRSEFSWFSAIIVCASCTTCAHSASRRPINATFAPFATAFSTVAFHIPLVHHVIKITLFSSQQSCFCIKNTTRE